MDGGFDLKKLKQDLPELPEAKRIRFKKEFNIADSQIEPLVSNRYVAEYFEEAVSEFDTLDVPAKQKGIKTLANYLVSDTAGLMNQQGLDIQAVREKMPPKHFAELGGFIVSGVVSSMTAKNMLADMITTGATPQELIQGKEQISDESEIAKFIEEVIAEDEDAVASYRKGKTNALQFLAGQVMAKARGRANPETVQNLLKEKLK